MNPRIIRLRQAVGCSSGYCSCALSSASWEIQWVHPAAAAMASCVTVDSIDKLRALCPGQGWISE